MPLLLKFTEMNLLCFIKSKREVELSGVEWINLSTIFDNDEKPCRKILFEIQIGKIYKWKSLKIIIKKKAFNCGHYDFLDLIEKTLSQIGLNTREVYYTLAHTRNCA